MALQTTTYRLSKSKAANTVEIGEYARFVAEFVDAAKRFQKLDSWKSELPAVATHWLLSGGEPIDFFGAGFRAIWREFVANYGINGIMPSTVGAKSL